MLNKWLHTKSLLAFFGVSALTACSHYAPGYYGWTTSQVDRIKGDAKARYYRIPENDTSLLGVNYIDFDRSSYTTYNATQATPAKCNGEIYKNIRKVESVSLTTSVCLNSSKEINRIIFYFKGPINDTTSKVLRMANEEINNNYGAMVFHDLENRFITKDNYKSIYFSNSPSKSALMEFNSIRVSDYITRIEVTGSNSASRADGFERMIFDVMLRDYETIQKKNALQSIERIKSQLNSL